MKQEREQKEMKDRREKLLVTQEAERAKERIEAAMRKKMQRQVDQIQREQRVAITASKTNAMLSGKNFLDNLKGIMMKQ